MKTPIPQLLIIVALSLQSLTCFSQEINDNHSTASGVSSSSEPYDSNRTRIWDKITAHLASDLKYPAEGLNAGIRDTVVYVSAVLKEDGSIVKVKVRKAVGYGFDEEALRVILSMRDFEPVVVEGKPVPVKLLIPVRFKVDQRVQ